jgi:subtilisin
MRAGTGGQHELFLRTLSDFAETRIATGAAAGTAAAAAPLDYGIKVLDAIHEDGAKLISIPTGNVSKLRASQPGLRVVPIVYYEPALAPRPVFSKMPKIASVSHSPKVTLKIVSAATGKPVPGADVRGFVDVANQIGDGGITTSKGEVSLALGGTKKIERLYVFPAAGYWSLIQEALKITSGLTIKLKPLTLDSSDSLRYFYGDTPLEAGADVRVAVVDTGISNHVDLQISGGENTVQGENPADFGDNGLHHGMHVAGIVAARGTPPTGIRGLAPSVTLRSYRVFGKEEKKASNFAIAKAIDRATADACDIINLSLGGGPVDEVTQDSIADARAAGCLVVCAAGNDGRKPVSFPASDSQSIAVSAMGRKKTFPASSAHVKQVGKPLGRDRNNFVAVFTNIGSEIDLIAPGVAVISTVPDGYIAWDGTSMACPAVSGVAARLLSGDASVRAMPRNQARSDAIAQLLLKSASSMGFGANYEGQGRPA